MTTDYSITNPVAEKIRLLWEQYISDGRPGEGLDFSQIPSRTFNERLDTLFLAYISGHENQDDSEPTFGQSQAIESQLIEMYAAYIDGWNPDGSGGSGGARAVTFNGQPVTYNGQAVIYSGV